MDCRHEWEVLIRYHIGTKEGSAESLGRYGVHVRPGTGRIERCVKCDARRDDPDSVPAGDVGTWMRQGVYEEGRIGGPNDGE